VVQNVPARKVPPPLVDCGDAVDVKRGAASVASDLRVVDPGSSQDSPNEGSPRKAVATRQPVTTSAGSLVVPTTFKFVPVPEAQRVRQPIPEPAPVADVQSRHPPPEVSPESVVPWESIVPSLSERERYAALLAAVDALLQERQDLRKEIAQRNRAELASRSVLQRCMQLEQRNMYLEQALAYYQALHEQWAGQNGSQPVVTGAESSKVA